MIRVRFPPSPTGYMHIGNVRTALFNYLFAKSKGGKLILRIEDTDKLRSKKEYEEDIIDGLKWLGIEWDEGPDIGGPYGPYRQSERLDIYKKYIDKLLKEDKAYYCFCAPEELQRDREEAIKRGEMPKYSRRCRNLTEEERRKKFEEGRIPVVRFKTPLSGEVKVYDRLRGELTFPMENLDDFVILRSDGIPTYNFAVVIDDALMKITHVMRGEDHLHGNTPRQVLLYEALGFPVPEFIHLPMILGEDHTKLSKRHGSVSLRDYRFDGFLPEALINYMALLGWSPKSKEKEFFTMEELIKEFDIDNLSKSNAIFSLSKLKWMNHKYMETLPLEVIFERVKPFVKKEFPSLSDNWIKEATRLLREHMTLLKDLNLIIKDIFSPPPLLEDDKEYLKEFIPLLEGFMKNLSSLSEWNENEILSLIRKTGKELGFKGKRLYFPLRVAITHKREGPEIYIYIYLLGKEESVKRLSDAISEVKGA
ncbi:MAG: glutamate--tRNA ligase [Caldiserica bacterium]|nr:MAG: glutamate--tRNA ligase [Caldisericota bacterium]